MVPKNSWVSSANICKYKWVGGRWARQHNLSLRRSAGKNGGQKLLLSVQQRTLREHQVPISISISHILTFFGVVVCEYFGGTQDGVQIGRGCRLSGVLSRWVWTALWNTPSFKFNVCFALQFAFPFMSYCIIDWVHL